MDLLRRIIDKLRSLRDLRSVPRSVLRLLTSLGVALGLRVRLPLLLVCCRPRVDDEATDLPLDEDDSTLLSSLPLRCPEGSSFVLSLVA